MNSRPSQGSGKGIVFGAVLAIAVIGGGIAIWLALRSAGDPGGDDVPPVADAELTAEAVELFHVGVAALEIDENQRAVENFEQLSRQLPREPAVWANLGVARLRLGELPAARQALSRAGELAPNNDAVTLLRAIVEDHAGEVDAAMDLLGQLHDMDAPALNLQAGLLERSPREGADRERLETIDRILKLQPTNYVAQFGRARMAAKLEDATQLNAALAELGGDRNAWDEQALEFFDAARAAAAAGDFREAATSLTFLENVSKPSPRYQESLVSLGVFGNSIGEPISAFLKLTEPGAEAAEPDLGIKFTLETVGDGQEPAAGQPARVDWFSARLVSADRPTRLALEGDSLRVGTTAALRFPRDAGQGFIGLSAVLPVDLNADFLEDLALVGPLGLSMYLQAADGQFQPIELAEHREVFSQPGQGVWAFDYEADGDLDLLVSLKSGESQLIRNNGDLTFTPVDALRNVPAPRDLWWTDLDRDGDTDMAVLDGVGRLLILWNERAGEYTVPVEIAGETGIVAGAIGQVEFVVLHQDGVIRSLAFDRDRGEWSRSELAKWTEPPDLKAAFADGRASLWQADLDNNGAVDVVASAANASGIWLNSLTSPLTKLPDAPGLFVTSVIDLNDDGRLDLAGLTDNAAATMRNSGKQDYHWQTIEPRANPHAKDKRINSFGLGGTIEVRAGRLTQTAPITSPRAHFGLGTHDRVGVARIVWPNGVAQAEFDLTPDTMVTTQQRLKGSCPFVFARNDEGWHFVKDFIWRSPLGLKINSQETAGVTQTEDWIKIPGPLLSPRDGQYDIRVTAELWETHFFDAVSLLVVDHPPEADIYVDERFIANHAPALEVVATTPPRPLKVARDHSGGDVSGQLASIDGRYVDSFALGTYQGVAEEHWLEFELPDEAGSTGDLVLVGHGWVYPTDSSLNVAMSQGNFPRPSGLILEVQESDGTCRPVSPDMGFPAGKNKNVLLPWPAEVTPPGQRRFRLRTNLEVYWDFLGWSHAAPGTELKTVRLEAEVAELRRRGFSELSPADRRKPDIPRYDRLAGVGQRWRDLEGYYTRFGDVRELLATVDDRYVIMNAGDEFVLRFANPGPPPPGWTRDFVLIGDGWVKDGDYNTQHSKTVHPLPSHDDPDYSGMRTSLFDDPVHRRHAADWRRLHTRYVTPYQFERGLRGVD